MGDFDEYDYLEKAVEAGTNGKAPDREDEEEVSEKEKERVRRSRSREDRGRRERDADDGEDVVRPASRSRERERDRSLERDEGDRERDRGAREPRRERDYTFRGGDRGGDRDRDRDRDYRDRRPRERDHDRGRGGRDGHRDRRGGKDKDEPEADPERDQRTVFAYQINLRADERDLYEFFSQAGKVRDVRLIMDRNGRRSKGVGYIEFYDAMSVPMAIALRGQPLMGTPVMVKPSEAEKNLAAQTPLPGVAAIGALPGMPGLPGLPGMPAGGMLGMALPSRRLHISNLHVNMNEDQLKQVVEPFGALETVQVPVDEATKQCKGFGFVTYSKLEDSRIAQQYLNDMEVAGLKIKVQFVPESMVLPDTGAHVNAGELDGDDGGGLSLNSQSRALLMQKLAGGGVGAAPGALGLLGAANPLAPGILAGLPGAPALPGVVLSQTEIIGTPSEYLLLKNMFKSGEEVDDEFEKDIMEDVEAECSKFGSVVKVHVDRKNAGGQVYVQFKEIEGASKARQALHNRWFAGMPIGATFMDAAEFATKVGA